MSIKERILEIKARIFFLPTNMMVRHTEVPMKVRDPSDPRKMIDDPHGRMQQTRVDVVDVNDPFNKPIIHFHKFPDHPMYEKNWNEFAEAFAHMKTDIEFLIKLLEEKL